MTLEILFLAPEASWPDYRAAFPPAFSAAGLDARIAPDIADESADYIVYAPQDGPAVDFARFPRARAVLSLWAGVERIIANPTLAQPLARMADSGLAEGMTEYVTGHVLRYHLGLDGHLAGQDGVWRPESLAPLARDRTIAVLGLGALGSAVAAALAALNFRVHGWSRRAREVPRVTCHSGAEGLADVLSVAETLVLLLPQTQATENILNAETLARLPRGARIINPGRGPLIDDDALLAALDNGQIGHATLDVFRTEPLPADHPYWSHPNVTVTPHIASATRPGTAAAFVARNIARFEAGLPLLAQVDRDTGY